MAVTDTSFVSSGTPPLEPDVADLATIDAAETAAKASAAPAPSEPAEAPLDPAVAALCQALTEQDPCGEDLDAGGDADYLNFFAQAEGLIPTSFFSTEDGRPFDRASVDFAYLSTLLQPLLKRTRDIRLLIIQARMSILNKDLAGFAVNLAAIAFWFDKYWDAVHPRPQDGDCAVRNAAISMLDMPTVVFPLQYAPLLDSRRLGPIAYRGWMIATGEVNAREGEDKVSPSGFAEAVSEANADALAATRSQLAMLKGSLDRIRKAYAGHGMSDGLEKLPALVVKIIGFIDPTALTEDTGKDQGAGAGKFGSAVTPAGPTPASLADASDALAAIADYYSRSEPSSPVLPLARQAHRLIGKSFVEIMNVLVPTHVESAAFQIGDGQSFDLPVGKLAELCEVTPDLTRSQPPGAEATPPDGSAPAHYHVESRSQAVALLEQVQRFFQRAEPSSPVPMLCERARAMAQQDFMGLLKEVLPKSALKVAGADG